MLKRNGKLIFEIGERQVINAQKILTTNGYYINNVIKSDSELKSGDKIQIGKYLLLLTEVMKWILVKLLKLCK